MVFHGFNGLLIGGRVAWSLDGFHYSLRREIVAYTPAQKRQKSHGTAEKMGFDGGNCSGFNCAWNGFSIPTIRNSMIRRSRCQNKNTKVIQESRRIFARSLDHCFQ
jgi:hypothetical protein